MTRVRKNGILLQIFKFLLALLYLLNNCNACTRISFNLSLYINSQGHIHSCQVSKALPESNGFLSLFFKPTTDPLSSGAPCSGISFFLFSSFFYGGLRTSAAKKQSKKYRFQSCLAPAPWQHRPQRPANASGQHGAKVTLNFP